MRINSIDFVAEQLRRGALFQAATHESFSAAKAKMNEWLSRNEVEIVNVETVVLPSLHSPREEGSEDVALSNAHKMALALLEYLPASQAARVAAKLNDVPRRKVYELLK